MFLRSFLQEKINKRVSPGLILFSAGIAFYAYKQYYAPHINLALVQAQKSEAVDKIRNALKPHYPLCFESMLEIYEAAGLMPLLECALANEKPQNTLIVLNTILQKMFLRPRGMERHQLNDEIFLKLLKTNLQSEYAKLSLSTPPIDAPRLRNLLCKSNIWEDETLEQTPAVTMALLFGASYLEYKNRQDFFLQSVSNRSIRLVFDFSDNFPVYLLGGDRPLDPFMDKPILDQFELSKQLPKPSNEQEMMNAMFDEAVKTIDLPQGRLVRISTDSPKEQENPNRPTTAGTLDSFIAKAKLQPNSEAKHHIVAISAAPFIRYQRLVTQRQLLKYNIRNVNLTVMGPNITQQMQAHSELQASALIATTVDNLARELWEITEINRLQCALTQSPLRRQKSLRSS